MPTKRTRNKQRLRRPSDADGAKARGDAVKLASLTKLDKQNLDRFGCTFKEKADLFAIDWRGKTAEQASGAEIFANLGSLETKAGPLVILAFEISVVRPLPSYCYFPFDLTNRSHLKYLLQLTQTGEIRLCFVAGRRVLSRTHLLGTYARSRAAELFAGAQQTLERYGAGTYDFESAVRLSERGVRVPEFVEQLISANDFSEILERARQEVQAVPNEKRDLAMQIVQDALRSVQPYFETNKNFLLQKFQHIRRGLLCMADLHRGFSINAEQSVVDFLSNAVAASFSQEDLENLNGWVKVGPLLLTLPIFTKPAPEPQDSMMVPQPPAELSAAIQLFAAGRGISVDSLRRFSELLGLEIGGKPGRPPRDYSVEYNLKASRLSWAKVARQSLRENSELHEEFGGRDFDSLTFEEREGLTNRIRQGVTSYAKRVGKPLPPRLAAVQPALAEGEQKTPDEFYPAKNPSR